MPCCKKCGIIVEFEAHIRNGKCPFCDAYLVKIPSIYTNDYTIEQTAACDKNVREKFIIPGTEYNEELYKAREELESQIGSKIWEKGGEYWKEGYPSPMPLNVPKCPICGSTNIEKISLGNKVGSVALIGVFAVGHITKTYKCKNCNAKF